MDSRIRKYADAIQTEIEHVDRTKDRDKLLWAHGLITGILSHITAKLRSHPTANIDTSEELKAISDSLARTKAELDDISPRHLNAAEDSLKRLAHDIEDIDSPPDPSAVPVRKTPGPTGKSGGAAEELPN